jgi:hypothetical protein
MRSLILGSSLAAAIAVHSWSKRFSSPWRWGWAAAAALPKTNETDAGKADARTHRRCVGCGNRPGLTVKLVAGWGQSPAFLQL